MGPRPQTRRLSAPAAVLLALAGFAFLVSHDFTGGSAPGSVALVMSGGVEHDLMQQHEQRPKLEASLAAAQQRPARQPHPPGLGGQPWKAQQPLPGGVRIAFIVTTSDSLQQIRVWINYHRALGVTTFYIFAEGQAARPDSVAALQALPGVTVVLRDAELKRRHEGSRIWKESWLSAFFHKPCNHELFVLQSLNMEGKAGQHLAVAPCPAVAHAACGKCS